MAGVVTFVGFIPYVIAVRRGETKPSRATWWIWTIACGALFASYYASGERSSIWVPLSYVVGPLVIGVLSLKYGEGRFTRFDKGCVAASLLGLLFWWLSGSPMIALGANIAVDFAGALPTMRKTYIDPTTESPTAWGVFLAGSALNLFAVERWTSAAAVLPIYFFAINLIITLLALRQLSARPIKKD